jgi:hypothetical protein
MAVRERLCFRFSMSAQVLPAGLFYGADPGGTCAGPSATHRLSQQRTAFLAANPAPKPRIVKNNPKQHFN